jgi:redox-sensing transcriptional repressor
MTDMEQLPERTVERLSHYRRVLNRLLDIDKEYIYSHELAKLLHITPVQVRRDIMLIGHTGTLRKGYRIKDLVDLISSIIDSENVQNVAIVGFGNLGNALLNYINNIPAKMQVKAIFDVNKDKIGTSYNEVICYSTDRIREIITRYDITIALLTVPPNEAQRMANILVDAGIRGIINYTPTILNVESAYLEQYDMITSLEKVAYFTKPEFFI